MYGLDIPGIIALIRVSSNEESARLMESALLIAHSTGRSEGIQQGFASVDKAMEEAIDRVEGANVVSFREAKLHAALDGHFKK